MDRKAWLLGILFTIVLVGGILLVSVLVARKPASISIPQQSNASVQPELTPSTSPLATLPEYERHEDSDYKYAFQYPDNLILKRADDGKTLELLFSNAPSALLTFKVITNAEEENLLSYLFSSVREWQQRQDRIVRDYLDGTLVTGGFENPVPGLEYYYFNEDGGGPKAYGIVLTHYNADDEDTYLLRLQGDFVLQIIRHKTLYHGSSLPKYDLTDEQREIARKVIKTVAPFTSEQSSAVAAETPIPTTEVTLYFVDTNSPDYQTNCGAVSSVKRTVPSNLVTPDTIVQLLLSGTTESEAARGLESTAFEPVSWFSDEVQPLRMYYQGASIRDAAAVLDFSQDAMMYLNSTTCIQEAVKNPIARTLKEVFSIEEVQYSIDGKIVTEWDA